MYATNIINKHEKNTYKFNCICNRVRSNANRITFNDTQMIMKKQRVVILSGEAYVMEKEINALLDEWYIVSITAQHVSTASSSGVAKGSFLILLEKEV